MGKLSVKQMRELKKRLLYIKYINKQNHIGSCWTALPIIANIYEKMKEDDVFILSSGHAGVALYVVLESKGLITKEQAETLESHPYRNPELGIHCSTGSLGHGIGVAVGVALSKIDSNVYCLLSDGEMTEGSVWEALTFAEKECVYNLHVIINANGWTGLEDLDEFALQHLEEKVKVCFPNLDIKVKRTNSDIKPHLIGLDSHYKSLTKEQYETIIYRKSL